MYCRKCGNKLKEDDIFCNKCGYNVNDEKENQYDNKYRKKRKEKKGKMLIWIFIICIGIIMAVIVANGISAYIENEDIQKLKNIEFNSNLTKSQKENEKKEEIDSISIYNAYKNIIISIYNDVSKISYDDISVEYFLVDINKDSVQELVVIEKKEDGNFATKFYTFKNHVAKQIGEINPSNDTGYFKKKNENYLIKIAAYPKEKVKDPYDIDMNRIEIVETSHINYNNSSLEIQKIETKEMTLKELDNYIVENKYENIAAYSFNDMSELEKLK